MEALVTIIAVGAYAERQYQKQDGSAEYFKSRGVTMKRGGDVIYGETTISARLNAPVAGVKLLRMIPAFNWSFSKVSAGIFVNGKPINHLMYCYFPLSLIGRLFLHCRLPHMAETG